MFRVFFPARRGTQTFLSPFGSVRAFTANPRTWKSLLNEAEPLLHTPGDGLLTPSSTQSSSEQGRFFLVTEAEGTGEREAGDAHTRRFPSGLLLFDIRQCWLVLCSFLDLLEGVGNSWQTFWDRVASGKTFVLAPATETVALFGSACCQGIRV